MKNEKVILTNVGNGATTTGILNPAPGNINIPAALFEAKGPGDFRTGLITLPREPALVAIYNVETAADEADDGMRAEHAAWLKAGGLKPGDAIGYAIDKTGNLYRFKSA